MQSGKGKTKMWVLEFLPETSFYTEGLMGWNGMTDMRRELLLKFPTKEAAVEYASKNHIEYEIFEANPAKQCTRAYADNFAFNRIRAF